MNIEQLHLTSQVTRKVTENPGLKKIKPTLQVAVSDPYLYLTWQHHHAEQQTLFSSCPLYFRIVLLQ